MTVRHGVITVIARNIVPCRRELDLDVFNILKTGLITKAALDTEMNTRVRTMYTDIYKIRLD